MSELIKMFKLIELPADGAIQKSFSVAILFCLQYAWLKPPKIVHISKYTYSKHIKLIRHRYLL